MVRAAVLEAMVEAVERVLRGGVIAVMIGTVMVEARDPRAMAVEARDPRVMVVEARDPRVMAVEARDPRVAVVEEARDPRAVVVEEARGPRVAGIGMLMVKARIWKVEAAMAVAGRVKYNDRRKYRYVYVYLVHCFSRTQSLCAHKHRDRRLGNAKKILPVSAVIWRKKDYV